MEHTDSINYFGPRRLKSVRAAIRRATQEIARAEEQEREARSRRTTAQRNLDALVEIERIMVSYGGAPGDPVVTDSDSEGSVRTSDRRAGPGPTETSSSPSGARPSESSIPDELQLATGTAGVLELMRVEPDPWTAGELAEVGTYLGVFRSTHDNLQAARAALKRLYAQGLIKRVGRGLYAVPDGTEDQ